LISACIVAACHGGRRSAWRSPWNGLANGEHGSRGGGNENVAVVSRLCNTAGNGSPRCSFHSDASRGSNTRRTTDADSTYEPAGKGAGGIGNELLLPPFSALELPPPHASMGDFGCHAATGTAAPTAPAPESSELSFKESISTTGVDEQLSQLFMQSRTTQRSVPEDPNNSGKGTYP
jgi:hypothetical protein